VQTCALPIWVAVMKDGEILQIGTPTDLYSNPKSPFIADFVGTSNILPGKVIDKEDGFSIVEIGDYQLKSTTVLEKESVKAIIRPENIKIVEQKSNDFNHFTGVVEQATYLGSIVRYEIKVNNYNILVDSVYESGEKIYNTGFSIKLEIEPERVLLI